MQYLLGLLVGPSLIAAFFTYVGAVIAEHRRAHRDFITQLFDEAADSVREAMQAAVSYHSSSTGKTLRLLEANVMLYESEVRNRLVILNNVAHVDAERWKKVNLFLQDFLSEITGGNFGVSMPTVDIPRCSRLVGVGSNLRGELLSLRQEQLAEATRGPFREFFNEMNLAKIIGFNLVLLMIAIYVWLVSWLYTLLSGPN